VRAVYPQGRKNGRNTNPRPYLGAHYADGRLYDDIDTDMIFHNRYLAITEVAKMGQYALDNLKGWEDFAKRAHPGDIVLAGKNFGAGSSRQQAVDCFRAWASAPSSPRAMARSTSGTPSTAAFRSSACPI